MSIKTLRFEERFGRNVTVQKLLGNKEPQGLVFATGRQGCVGEMNMGKSFLALVPKFARAMELGDDERL